MHGEQGHVHDEKCFTVPYNESIQGDALDRFELWLREKRQERAQLRTEEEEVYIIPVVVHVIHRGEAIGTETNIPIGQIQSQIATLNEDFRRLNADTTNAPDNFRAVARDTRIEFRLATIDPEGRPTNGIVRVNGQRDTWNPSTRDAELKSLSYWPAEDYINMWSAPLSNNILGYAQFPFTNLAGISPNNTARLTDGVVVDYRFFGSGFNAVASSKGRTMTHEIGHYLGLRHIWGDGDCSVDDFCDDTPNASRPSTGCPPNKATCDTPDMVQNYMDYSSDECMSIFTACQKERMLTVLLNSPRRKSLLNSPAVAPPINVSNDLAILRDLSALEVCSKSSTPAVRVYNAGNNNINNFQLRLSINEVEVQTLTVNQTLNTSAETTVTFDGITFAGEAEFAAMKVEVVEVNGTTDGNPANNILNRDIYVPATASFPIEQNFQNGLGAWAVRASADAPSWNIGTAVNGSENNQAIVANMFENGELGNTALLYSPVFNLESNLERAFLTFRLAYQARQDIRNDILNVYISTDCGASFSNDRLLFRRINQNLSPERPRTNTAFNPSSPLDWTTFRVDLAPFIGQDNLVIIFEVKNGRGNNLFLDDITIDDQLEGVDIGISEVTNPSIIACDNFPRLGALVTNFGEKTINYFEIIYFVNGQGQFGYAYTVNLEPGQSIIANPDSVPLNDGIYDITIRVQNPNRTLDEDLSNNVQTKRVAVNSQISMVPFREGFRANSFENIPWTAVPESGSMNWTMAAAPGLGSGNLAPFLNYFGNTNIGSRQWMGSPILDLKDYPNASATFMVSHAQRTGRSDSLLIYASTDCGENWDRLIYAKSSADLAVVNQNAEWYPEVAADWKQEFVDLSTLGGLSDVRLAFVGVNGNGNNLFVDNFELFLSDRLPPVRPTENYIIYPNPSNTGLIDITFNTPERRNVEIRIFNSFGQFVRAIEFTGTLNQTYGIDLSAEGNGLYILEVKVGNELSTRKIVLNK